MVTTRTRMACAWFGVILYALPLLLSEPLAAVAETEEEEQIDFSFSQEVHLDSRSLMPSELRFSSPNEVRSVRALLTLDGRLLVAPMKEGASKGEFLLEFPSPTRTLNYQFQITIGDGTRALTPKYSVAELCPKLAAESISGDQKRATKALRAVNLETDIARMTRGLEVVEQVLR